MKKFLRGLGYSLMISLTPSVAMGYDLHITRASPWSENSKQPITEKQWKALVLADGELKMDAIATAENPKTHEVIRVSNPLMASWVDPQTGKKHYFYYSRGQIIVKNPSERAIEKMKAVASRLGARVQGDEGEWY